MRVSLDWLAEWIDLPPSREELASRLTFGGLEIEDMLRTGPDLSRVHVGLVLERAAHPDADRLSLCTVDAGEGPPVEVVCGAPNVAAGQKVALARPGVTLPDGTVLKRAKIRGVLSDGMICSERELGIGDDHQGILVLDRDAPLGAPLSDVLNLSDVVLDVEITPNRGDWASMLGIAREVRAHFGGALRLPEVEPDEDGPPATGEVGIEIEDAAGCHRYLGRVVRGVRVGPSPEWLRRKLEVAGLRAINVVVDVTNLVLLEFGQPLHAFDLATLRGRRIAVRRAGRDEKLATLDGQMRELEPADMVIADAERPVAVAGVMGGAETEVREETTDVLLECAHFDPRSVRRTARRLGLATDASYRFERGVDSRGLRRAIDRAARLIAELAGGTVAGGIVEALGAPFEHTGRVAMHPEHPNRLLGTSLSRDQVIDCLARLDIEATPDGDGELRCAIPSHRNDIAIAEDLVEEVARVWGYERIPETLPAAPLRAVEEPPRHALEYRLRTGLCASGWIEVRTAPWARESDPDALGLAPDDERRRTLRVLNPQDEDAPRLRSTLLPSLLRVVRHNLAHQVERMRIFELGPHFRPRAPGELPDELLFAAGVVTGGERPGWWRTDTPVFFEAKGALERLLAGLGRKPELRVGSEQPYLHPGSSAELWLSQVRVASLGELHPQVAASFELDVPCAVFELDLGALLERPGAPPAYHEVSRFPAVRRDVAVLLDRECAAGDVLEAIRKTGGRQLVSAEIFDRYEGAGIPEGKVSLAFRMVLQRPDRTLLDSEITKMTDRVRQMLVHRFGGELR